MGEENGELEVAVLLLGFAALLSLPVVVPWFVIRVTVFVLEADAEATVGDSTASASEPDRATIGERTTEVDSDRRSRQVSSERGLRDQ